ncbi:3-oxoacyl-[acyl-carrier-protein] synthase III C-terminal domain-containing protein [Streptomyces sp. NPDC002793]|uniref:3-oxoacyl-[acyl-carrier-protein] synthase III C-terminal domain-containing protein n=1 Tax=Streptomyces sp. NPDC002793 TaxID=3154432 RepID=UPI00332285F9
MLWQDITIAGTGAWVPPIRPAEQEPQGGPGTRQPSTLALNGFTSAAVSTDNTATQMAARAGLRALRHADVPSADLSLLVHAGFQDGDHYTPVAYLTRVLGGKDTTGIEVGAASDGGAAALVTAAEHLTARPAAQAALVTTGARFPDERWGYSRELGYVAGDAGAAAVLTRGTGFARLVATAHVTEPQLEAQTRAREGYTGAARRFPVEETGFMPHIEVLQRATHRCIGTVLDEAAVKPADISHVVPIAIGSVVLDLLLSGSPLGLRADDTTWTYGRHLGHAGPSDVLLALDRTFRSGTLRAGDRVLVVSFGVGFRWTTALIEITRDAVGAASAGGSPKE